MSQTEKTYLATDEFKVTEELLSIGKRSFEISQIKKIRMLSEPSYRSRAIPSFLAVVFVVWTLSEIVNDPDDYTIAVITGVFAVAAMLVLKLMSFLKTHTVWLTTSSEELAIYRSTDSGTASSLVMATQQAMSHSAPQELSGWSTGKIANG